MPAAAQQSSGPIITFPSDRQVLQGQVSVRGSTDIPYFSSAELAFSYESQLTNPTWFVIQAASLPLANDVIAVWDTTSITDGDYVLRLRVYLGGGGFQDATVRVQVRNYTPTVTPSSVVTATSLPALEVPTAIIIAASETPEQPPTSIPATPTLMPENPARLTASEVYAGFWRGAVAVAAVILLFGAILWLRRQ